MSSRKDKEKDFWSKDKYLKSEDKDKNLQVAPRGQGLSSRTTTLGYSEERLTYWHILVSNIWHQKVRHSLPYPHVWWQEKNLWFHVIIHNGLFAECEVLRNFRGLCNTRTKTWGPRTRTCKLVLEDPRVQGLSSRTTTLPLTNLS